MPDDSQGYDSHAELSSSRRAGGNVFLHVGDRSATAPLSPSRSTNILERLFSRMPAAVALRNAGDYFTPGPPARDLVVAARRRRFFDTLVVDQERVHQTLALRWPLRIGHFTGSTRRRAARRMAASILGAHARRRRRFRETFRLHPL